MTVRLETNNDTIRENLIITILNSYGSVQFERYSNQEFAVFDYKAMCKGKLISVVELKCRQNKSTTYPTLILSKSKFDALYEMTLKGVSARLIAAFTDGLIYAIDITKITDNSRPFKRTTKRNSGLIGANDSEFVVDIPIKNMRLIGVIPAEMLQTYIN